MSTTITTPRRAQGAHTSRLAGLARSERRGRQPWAHHGVASERAQRAEQAYTAELVLAERAERAARARAVEGRL